MTGEATDRSDLQKMQIGEATDLVALKRLAEDAATIDPIGPGWYSKQELSRFMEPVDAELTAIATPATILSLATLIEAQAAEIEGLRAALQPFSVYYQINDLDERLADDAIEVPVGDLRQAYRVLASRTERGDADA